MTFLWKRLSSRGGLQPDEGSAVRGLCGKAAAAQKQQIPRCARDDNFSPELQQHRRHAQAVLPIRRPEPCFQLTVFNPDHEKSSHERKSQQREQRHQPRAHAPPNNLAQVSEIDRMPHTSANTSGHQFLPVPIRLQFIEARNLGNDGTRETLADRSRAP